MAALNDPTDQRSFAEKLLDYTRAWTAAMEEVTAKLQEEQNRSKEDSDLINTMIADARIAIPKGTSVQKFTDDQLWAHPVNSGRTEADIKEKAKNAYRVAEMRLKTEARVAWEMAEQEELLKTAWRSVQIGQAEKAFVDQRVAAWRMHPDLKNMTDEHEAQLRQSASYAWNKAYQAWEKENGGKADGKTDGKTTDTNKPTPKPAPTEQNVKKPEEEDSGSSGFVTFIVVVIILAILGGIAYFLHK